MDIKVNFADGDYLFTRFNGSFDEAEKYYIGRIFNIGSVSDNLQPCVSIEKI